jgi:hypothetical protein
MSDILTIDLFGDAVTLPSGRRGRPAHKWSKSSADKVILGLAMGMAASEIANGLGISLPTLRKYYFSELKRSDMQRDRFELWRAHQLAELANAGNVTAIKELGKLMATRDRAKALAELGDDDDLPKAPRVGVKEQRVQAAGDAAKDSGWGELLPPKMTH